MRVTTFSSILQRREVFWIVAALWTLAVAVVSYVMMEADRAQIMANAEQAARVAFQQNMNIRRWATQHGGVYVRIGKNQKPLPWLAHLIDRDVSTGNGEQLTLLNPSSIVRQIQAANNAANMPAWRSTASSVLNPENAPDAWEQAQLKAFRRGDYKEISTVVLVDDQPRLRYLHALQMETGCGKCHDVQGYRLGDTFGASGINLPLAPFLADIERAKAKLAGSFGAVWLLGLLGLAIGNRRLRNFMDAESAAAVEARQSEARLHDLVQSSPDWIWEVDAQGRYTFVSARVTDLLGYQPEEVLGKTPFDFMPPEEAARVSQLFSKFIGERQSFNALENVNLRKDGQRVVLETAGVPVLGADGALLGYRGVDRDITESHRTQASLAASEQAYRSLFDEALDMIHSIDLNGNISDINPAELAALGYARAELIGKPARIIIHPDFYPLFTANFPRVLAGESLGPYPSGLLTRSGELLPVEISVSPQKSGGKAVGARAIIRNVRARLENEQALRDQEARLRAIAEASPVFFYEVDAEDRVVYANRSHAGRPVAQVCGEIVSDWFEAAEGERLRKQLSWVRRSGFADSGEYVLENGHGQARHFRIDFTLIDRASGQPAVLLTLRDIEDELHSKMAMRSQEAMLRAVLDAEPECIKVVDSSGRLRMMNAAGLAMIEADNLEQVKGQLLKGMIAEADLNAWLALFKRVQAGESGSLVFGIVGLKGARRVMESHAVPLVDEATGEVQMLAVTRDFTEYHKAEQARDELENRLQQASKMEALGQLSSGIAHDFNNILSSMLGYTNLALDRFVPDKESKLGFYLREVVAAGERAHDLTQKMLNYSRNFRQGDSGRSNPKRVLEAYADEFKSRLPSAIELEATYADVLPDIALNAADLQLILGNLLANAQESIDTAGGRITLSLDTVSGAQGRCMACNTDFAGDFVVLKVRDTGCGITPEMLDKVFDPFVTSKDAAHHAGMGLATVQSIVFRANGHLQIDSTPGAGSEVRVYFNPLNTGVEPVPADVAQQTARPLAEAHGGAGEERVCKQQIVVVDDEPQLAHMMGEVLEVNGYCVTVYVDSRQAMAAFKAAPQSFALVITDQTMPGMSGAEMSRAMLDIRPDLPIILCTGYSERMNATTAEALGVQRFFSKPVAIPELLKAMETLLGHAQD